MNTKNLDLSNKTYASKNVNKIALIGNFILCFVLAVAYLIEVFKGTRTIPSYLIIVLTGFVPAIVAEIIYLKDKASRAVRYITSVGFALLYAYLLFNTESELVFCYIIVFFVLMVIYADFKLLVGMGIFALVMNVLSILTDALTVGLTPMDITNAEIKIACVALTIIYTVMAVKKIAEINQANILKAAMEKQQSDELLDTTLNIAKVLTNNIKSAVSETDALKLAIDNTQKEMTVLTEETKNAANTIDSQRNNTNKINVHIQEIGDAMGSIVSEVANAEDNLKVGSEMITELLHQVQISETSSDQVTKEMDILKDYTNKMQDIMSLIQTVANQTGLLALNASIEAARAGEAGRGFSVVATEISNLSAQTKAATENISLLIQNVVKSVDQVHLSMEHLLESNHLQSQYVENTARNFDAIHNCTNEISHQITNLRISVETTTEANSLVAENVENVADIMQRSASGAYDTLTSCNINLLSIAKVIEIMNTLTQAATHLNVSADSEQ